MTVQFSAERTSQTCLCIHFPFSLLLRLVFFSWALLQGEETRCPWFFSLLVLQVMSDLKKLKKSMMQTTLCVEKSMSFYISYLHCIASSYSQFQKCFL